MTTALLSVPQHTDDIRLSVEELFEAVPTPHSSVCDECGRKFTNRNAKRMHMVKTHDRIEAESDAFLSSRSRSAFKASISGASNDVQQRFHCPHDACSKWFAGRKLLVQHYQKSHMEKRLRCEHCSNMFSLQRDLKYHLNNTCKALKRRASDEASADVHPATEDASARPEAKKPARKASTKKSKTAPLPPKTILLIPVSVATVPGRPILPRPTTSHTPSKSASKTIQTEFAELSQSKNETGCQSDALATSDQWTTPDDGFLQRNEFMVSMEQQPATPLNDSFAQTVYPETVEFGTQYSYAAVGAGSTNGIAIQTVATDAQCNCSIVVNSNDQAMQTSEEMLWRHNNETQTPPGSCLPQWQNWGDGYEATDSPSATAMHAETQTTLALPATWDPSQWPTTSDDDAEGSRIVWYPLPADQQDAAARGRPHVSDFNGMTDDSFYLYE